MNYSMHLLLTLTTVCPSEVREAADADQLAEVIEVARQRLQQLVEDFRSQPIAPLRTQQFEQQLQDALRELGRELVQWTYNHLEPASVATLAKHVRFEAGPYTRLNA